MADPDPRAELAQLEKSLADGALLPGYVLRGAERYFRDRALDAIKNAARKAGHELCLHDAKSLDFEAPKLLDDLMGNVSGGVVREPLVDRLVTAYGP